MSLTLQQKQALTYLTLLSHHSVHFLFTWSFSTLVSYNLCRKVSDYIKLGKRGGERKEIVNTSYYFKQLNYFRYSRFYRSSIGQSPFSFLRSNFIQAYNMLLVIILNSQKYIKLWKFLVCMALYLRTLRILKFSIRYNEVKFIWW